MKEEEIKELFEQFEAIANEYEGVECWSARELAQVLGYSKWERFEGVIERAKDACINAGEMVEYHFPGVGKMIPLAKGAQREVKDHLPDGCQGGNGSRILQPAWVVEGIRQPKFGIRL